MSATATPTPLIGPLAAVRVFTYDLDASRRFYGGDLALTESSTSAEWVVYDVGGPQLVVELADSEDEDPEITVGRFTGFSFAVTNAARVCEQLNGRGVTIVGHPELQPWGGTLAYVSDPAGNVITLVQYPTG